MRRNLVLIGLLGALVSVALVVSATGAAADSDPTIASDQADYISGSTVNLTGQNWGPGDQQVRIEVNDTAGQIWSRDVVVGVAGDGSVSDTFTLPSTFVAQYSVKATGQQTGRIATTTFTDLDIGTYDQCSNNTGTGYGPTDTGCRWLNGNLNKNNSLYQEGDATPQRLWLQGLTAGTVHTVTLKYGTTKGGKHAYDFLTTYDKSETWITLADRCEGIAGCETAAGDTLDIPIDPSVPDAYETAQGSRLFTLSGGMFAAGGATTPAIVSGSYAGDSETVITITFTVGASDGSMCVTDNKDVTTCSIVLWFGGHVAKQADWGAGTGAASIDGSPYHVALHQIDSAAAGQRDNQMQSDTDPGADADADEHSGAADGDADEHADEHSGAADSDADEHADEHAGAADSDADEHADEHSGAADGDADEHADEHPGAADGDADEHADEHPGAADGDADEHADADGHQHADQHADEHGDADGHQHADEHGDADGHQHADQHADEHGDADGHQHADEHPDEHGYADRHQHADEHGDADGHAGSTPRLHAGLLEEPSPELAGRHLAQRAHLDGVRGARQLQDR